tara:strand:+ start:1527 stop:2333 length:807 start_codon:yes stop_codon:yes gene_type:complete
MNFIKSFLTKKFLKDNKYFYWDSGEKNFKIIKKLKSVNLNILVGIDKQKNIIFNNTINFAKGNLTNNALLWGSRGNGKSSLIKSIFNEVSQEYNNLKLIQLNKDDLNNITNIYTTINKFEKMRFIIFIDDLSFETINNDYKIIKSTLDGSIINQPSNIIIYITSNRRHLMPRDMIDNEKSSAIHTDENIDEKVSLSDRFGLWVGFHNISQNTYLKIIKTYFDYYKIKYNQNDLDNSIKWSLSRGNRTGRTAWQFILNMASEKNLRIDF